MMQSWYNPINDGVCTGYINIYLCDVFVFEFEIYIIYVDISYTGLYILSISFNIILI